MPNIEAANIAGRKSVVTKDFLDGLARSVRDVELLPPTIVTSLASQFLSFTFLGQYFREHNKTTTWRRGKFRFE